MCFELSGGGQIDAVSCSSQMCECQKDSRHEWFQPLFTGLTFDEQWKELEKLFGNIK
jgi:hypothetical protein